MDLVIEFCVVVSGKISFFKNFLLIFTQQDFFFSSWEGHAYMHGLTFKTFFLSF